MNQKNPENLGALYIYIYISTLLQTSGIRLPRKRELVFKPTKNGLFAVPKLYIKYRNLKDELCFKKYNSS